MQLRLKTNDFSFPNMPRFILSVGDSEIYLLTVYGQDTAEISGSKTSLVKALKIATEKKKSLLIVSEFCNLLQFNLQKRYYIYSEYQMMDVNYKISPCFHIKQGDKKTTQP